MRVTEVIASDLSGMRSGVVPDDAKEATQHIQRLFCRQMPVFYDTDYFQLF